MSRRNIYEQIDYDADWMRRDEKPALLGWFESGKAVFWSDRDHNGNGSGGTGRGQTVWCTAQGKWVLEHWSAWQDEESTYAFITPDEARDWLLRNDEDVAVRDHFGEVAEEEDRRPGRPAIGEPVNVRLGEELLSQVDAYAREHGHSRAEAIRIMLAEFLTIEQPYAVTIRDMATGLREGYSRHATLGAAIEMMRELYGDDHGMQGLPSRQARVEYDGRPVDVEKEVAGF